MRASAAMENLWLYLQSLPRSNKRWLSERLLEDLRPKAAEEGDEEYISKEEVLAGVDAGLKDLKEGRMRPARELLNELRNGI